ncbi:hypothetical protein [Geomesophilobacter sediminis]|uniref:Uncharacterized protein n=1 Tax=Geomesophilobacter sediminis TaxID=2798584 RepID=A0A8J7JEQ7_9BACT|nr:hypothetical protein [Geomesophilobacter sediminis]MBJ6724614.1 hypothetical protein [Geomesophilobacter sediminis]
MNTKQTVIAMKMLLDPRLPRDQSEVFSRAVLDAAPGVQLDIPDDRLEVLSQFLPELVTAYRKAGPRPAHR